MKIEEFCRPLSGTTFVRPIKLLYRSARLFPSLGLMTSFVTIAVGLTEGIGISMLLPILSLIGVQGGQSENDMSEIVSSVFGMLGIPFALWSVLLVFFLIGLLQIAFSTMQKILVVQARETLQYSLRVMLFDALSNASWAHLASERLNFVANAITTETTRIIAVVGYAITLIGTLVILGIYVSASYWISWQFTSLILVLGLISWVMLLPLYRLSLSLGTKTYKNSNLMQEVLNETLAAGRMIRAFNGQSAVRRMFGDATAELKRTMIRNQINAPLVNARVEPVALLVIVLMLYTGLEFAHLAPGEMVTMVVIFYRIFPRIVTLQERSQRIYAMFPSFDYLSNVMTQFSGAAEVSGTKLFTGLKNKIELSNVHLSLDSRTILDGVSLIVPAGSTIALVGPSGGGKSTILDLLLGLRSPDRGSVRYDGADISEFDLHSLRDRFGVVLQDGTFFNDTIRNNLLFARPLASDVELLQALELAHAIEFVREFTNGIETVVGDRGVRLSQGQRQRLALAQALLREPAILLLDEPTSALDQASEDAIRETLREVRGKMTIVVVSHRPTLMIDVDAIYTIADGEAKKAERAPVTVAQ